MRVLVTAQALLLMPGIVVRLDEQEAQEVRTLAQTLHQSPEEVTREIISNGMHMVRRWAYLKSRAETVNVDEVIAMLRSKRNDNPPDPGDELPEDLKYVLFEGRP